MFYSIIFDNLYFIPKLREIRRPSIKKKITHKGLAEQARLEENGKNSKEGTGMRDQIRNSVYSLLKSDVLSEGRITHLSTIIYKIPTQQFIKMASSPGGGGTHTFNSST